MKITVGSTLPEKAMVCNSRVDQRTDPGDLAGVLVTSVRKEWVTPGIKTQKSPKYATIFLGQKHLKIMKAPITGELANKR